MNWVCENIKYSNENIEWHCMEFEFSFNCIPIEEK
jgi:hypothetical protein